ncbi:flowering time control protein FCA-like isoform X2 [Aristolochia californica]|uniref:flowering time control protein FCA-like isoform X2 n=1 Tax=Aristolochia californica TaxID=171875 RepID=UPI0035E22552
MDRHRGDRDGNRHYSRTSSRSSSDRYHSNSRGGFSDGHSNNRSFNSSHQHNQPFGGGSGFRPMGGGGGGYGGAHSGPMSGQKRSSSGGFVSSGRGYSPDKTSTSGFAKLFIGSVPRTAIEEDIRPLFEDHGNVIEVALIKDKRTGQQQGCCFIKYATSEEADQAIRVLHNQVTLPGGTGPIQVRYADGERERLGKFQSASDFKLFVGSLNRQATEKEIEDIFSPYGHVEDVYIMRDEMKQCRGCAFVKFSHRDMATAAINALDGTYTMRGCDQPLTVRFADPKRPKAAESRFGPAYGGPGFGPQSQPPLGIRPTSDGADSMRMPPNAWQPMSPQTGVPSPQLGPHAFGNHLAARGGVGQMPSSTISSMGTPAGPTNGSLPGITATTSSSQQIQPFSQQISPLQKPLQSPQHLPSSQQLHPRQISPSFSQPHMSQAPIQQLSQMPLPHSIGQSSFGGQAIPYGLTGQPPISQPLVQQTGQQQTPMTGPQQQFHLPNNIVPSNQQPQLLQPIQQLSSQVRLPQQAQALQSSFQSRPPPQQPQQQQSYTQLQQQLHSMQQQQPTSQNLSQQLNPQATNKQQPAWTGILPQAAASTPPTSTAVVAPSTVCSTSVAAPVSTPGVGPLTCNWTEHTSPGGYKYYFNSVTNESRWEKPEELTLFEQQKLLQQQQQQQQQQKQQQKVLVPQLQSQPQAQTNAQVQHTQPISQVQQLQLQTQIRQQQQQYQASGVSGHQNIQGLQTAQEWTWNGKPAGATAHSFSL